jgi:hypothetical protein
VSGLLLGLLVNIDSQDHPQEGEEIDPNCKAQGNGENVKVQGKRRVDTWVKSCEEKVPDHPFG